MAICIKPKSNYWKPYCLRDDRIPVIETILYLFPNKTIHTRPITSYTWQKCREEDARLSLTRGQNDIMSRVRATVGPVCVMQGKPEQSIILIMVLTVNYVMVMVMVVWISALSHHHHQGGGGGSVEGLGKECDWEIKGKGGCVGSGGGGGGRGANNLII